MINIKNYDFYSIEEISTPKNNYRCITDSWWSLSSDGKVMIYNKYSPQCNSDKGITELISKKMYSGNVVFIPAAYVEIDARG